MTQNKLYTKFALTSFKYISLICAVFLIFLEGRHIINGDLNDIRNSLQFNYHLIFRLINLISAFFFILSFFFPQNIGNISVIAFLYSIMLISFEPKNYMGILMYFFGTSVLFARGLLKRNFKIKFSILGILLFSLILTHLRFGLMNFISYFLISAGGILILSLYTFFMFSYFSNALTCEEKKMNLALYPRLTERDCRILQMIQTRTKYSVIAKKENLSEGYLKNRLHFVYEILGTGDKQGFLSYYSDWNIYYNLKELEEEAE